MYANNEVPWFIIIHIIFCYGVLISHPVDYVCVRVCVPVHVCVCMYGRDSWGLWTSVLIIELSTLHSVLLRDTVEREDFANLLLQSF